LLFDTTLLIDAERGDASLDDVVADEDDVAMAAVTLAELEVGVRLASGRRRRARREYVDAVAATIPVVAYDAGTAAIHAGLLAVVREQGRPRGAHDLIIAATAAHTDRTVVTADPSGFADLPGVVVLTHRS
jgi:tRNA(fMet)-specific endonuclease VapC